MVSSHCCSELHWVVFFPVESMVECRQCMPGVYLPSGLLGCIAGVRMEGCCAEGQGEASPELTASRSSQSLWREGAAPPATGAQAWAPQTRRACSEQPTTQRHPSSTESKHHGTERSWEQQGCCWPTGTKRRPISLASASSRSPPAAFGALLHFPSGHVLPLSGQGHPPAWLVGSGWRLAAYLKGQKLL